ncbi:hypothetical protein B0H11DRAFT_2230052 [Mycena galericulata]|nr:hypothetical protein B0H11DRAFT_2230052 [Mycena galericulata]
MWEELGTEGENGESWIRGAVGTTRRRVIVTVPPSRTEFRALERLGSFDTAGAVSTPDIPRCISRPSTRRISNCIRSLPTSSALPVGRFRFRFRIPLPLVIFGSPCISASSIRTLAVLLPHAPRHLHAPHAHLTLPHPPRLPQRSVARFARFGVGG